MRRRAALRARAAALSGRGLPRQRSAPLLPAGALLLPARAAHGRRAPLVSVRVLGLLPARRGPGRSLPPAQPALLSLASAHAGLQPRDPAQLRPRAARRLPAAAPLRAARQRRAARRHPLRVLGLPAAALHAPERRGGNRAPAVAVARARSDGARQALSRDGARGARLCAADRLPGAARTSTVAVDVAVHRGSVRAAALAQRRGARRVLARGRRQAPRRAGGCDPAAADVGCAPALDARIRDDRILGELRDPTARSRAARAALPVDAACVRQEHHRARNLRGCRRHLRPRLARARTARGFSRAARPRRAGARAARHVAHARRARRSLFRALRAPRDRALSRARSLRALPARRPARSRRPSGSRTCSGAATSAADAPSARWRSACLCSRRRSRCGSSRDRPATRRASVLRRRASRCARRPARSYGSPRREGPPRRRCCSRSPAWTSASTA